MSRHLDVGDLITVVLGLGLGFFAQWAADTLGVNQNSARAAAYTTMTFALLAIALRQAWRRWQLWADLAVMFALHLALILPALVFLNSHSVRLNWLMALPFVALEFMLFLSALWRRNVGDSSR